MKKQKISESYKMTKTSMDMLKKIKQISGATITASVEKAIALYYEHTKKIYKI
jgi:hypothetical protein